MNMVCELETWEHQRTAKQNEAEVFLYFSLSALFVLLSMQLVFLVDNFKFNLCTLKTNRIRLYFSDFRERQVHFNGTVVIINEI